MYKTILLHVARDEGMATRLGIAIDLARRHGAHLIGCAATALPEPERGAAALEASATWAAEAATAALQYFSAEARRHGVASVAARLIHDHADAALVGLSPYADLIIAGQDSDAAVAAGIAVGVPDYVALHGCCPVMMVPTQCGARMVGRSVLVGWNASLEAAHAVHAALPLLQDAALVRIVVLDPSALPLRYSLQPGADLAAWLGCHGVQVDVDIGSAEGNTAQTLLQAARTGGADLVVAGAYGRNHFRELVPSGTTRALLDNATTCVLLAH